MNRTNADVMASDEFTSAALPMIHVVQDALTLGVLHKVLEWDDLEIVAVVSQGDPVKQAQAVEILVSGAGQAACRSVPPRTFVPSVVSWARCGCSRCSHAY